ncbi:NHL-repeat domain-containing protein (plasmid) [Chromobacterium vaccinii]|nr:NHL-repeat domain-containing protein [Chromobacterium vaccinii]QND87426.1 NHL-repeat domain-containing protein [Chromobacterium vaccinii]
MPDTANPLTRNALKTSFLAGKKPTASDFANVFDASLNQVDDHISVTRSSADGQSVAIALGNNGSDAVSVPGNLAVSGALQLGSSSAVSGVLTQDINLASQPKQQLVTASAVSQFVAEASLGLTLRAQARAVLTTQTTLSGTQTVDGVALQVGDKVLATRQGGSSGADRHKDNLLWVVQTGTWTRAPELDGNPYYELERGTAVMVTDGAVNGGKLWVMDSDPANPSWTCRTDLDYLRAGNGLAKQGLNLNLKLAAGSGLQVDGNGLAVDPGNGIAITSGGVSVVAGNGLDASGSAVSVKLAANSGLAADANGLKVAPGAGLAVDGGGVKIVAGSGLNAGSGALNLQLASNSGLQADGNGLAVDPGNGIAITGSGVSVVAGNGLDASGGPVNVKLAASSGLQVDSSGLRVSAASPLTLGASGLGLDLGLLDSNYLKKRIVFVAEAATADLTLQAVQAELNAGALLVATYKAS